MAAEESSQPGPAKRYPGQTAATYLKVYAVINLVGAVVLAFVLIANAVGERTCLFNTITGENLGQCRTPVNEVAIWAAVGLVAGAIFIFAVLWTLGTTAENVAALRAALERSPWEREFHGS